MNRYLLIDNSNTRTKFVVSTPDALTDERYVIPTRDVNAESLESLLSGVTCDFIVLCSVVPRVRELVRDTARRPLHVLDCDSVLNVGIDYPNPRQIGADRLANAVGAKEYYGTPCVVVDFGTAVTFDVIGAASCYLGGTIAPGLASMSDYLSSSTALLPTINPHEPSTAIGKSTEEAMHAGAVYGYRGLVKEILLRIEEELEGRPVVVATGGDAELISRGVKRIEYVDKDITLNGLRLIANMNGGAPFAVDCGR